MPPVLITWLTDRSKLLTRSVQRQKGLFWLVWQRKTWGRVKQELQAAGCIVSTVRKLRN